MDDVRVERLAALLVQHSIQAGPGDRVLIEAFDVEARAVAAMVRAVARAGAVPVVETRYNEVLRDLYLHATEEQMRLIGELEADRMRQVQCYIGLRGSHNSAEFSDVPQERMALYQRHIWRPVHLERRLDHTRWVVLRWPSGTFAQAAGMSTVACEEFYSRCCCFDYGRMEQAVAPLRVRMERACKVRVVGPGTDLHFRKDKIGVVPCVGHRNIPDGECFTAPIRDSVNGTIRFNAPTLYQGRSFDEIALTLQDGRIVGATASDPVALERILDADEGSRYLGEFSFGFHPHVLRPMRDTLFDEKIAGSIHLAIGNAYGGADNGNRSEIHWDLVQIHRPEFGGGEVYFDGELIRKDGLFVPDDLLDLNPDRLGAE